MPDHREQLARNLHIYSPSSTAHARHESEGDREFSFWGSSNTIISCEYDCDQLGVNEASLNINSEAEFGEAYKRKNFKFEEHSPFLPLSHHCCSLSDTSRSKAIEEGRKELMEMMQDMPESSYELSFQDMVVDEKHMLQPEPDKNETSLDNTHMQISSSNKAQSKKLKEKKKKNKSNNRPGQILRVESMDSETFLLKMFFPTSLAWMKKVKVENGSSKVSPRLSSFQESKKQEGKERRIKRFFQAVDNRGDAEDGKCQNTSSNNSSDKSRHVDRSSSFSSLGCWPFSILSLCKKQSKENWDDEFT